MPMFETPSEKETFIQTMGLHYGPEGQLLDDEGGLYNPYCFEYEYNGQWFAVIGIRFLRNEALEYLYELRRDNPNLRFRCYRANEIKTQAYIDYDMAYIYRGDTPANTYSRYPIHIPKKQ